MALVWYQRICKGFKLCLELWSSSLKISPFVLQLPIKLQKRSALIFTLEFSVRREQYTPISFQMIRRFSQHTGNHSKHEYPFFFFSRTARPIVWSGIQCTAQREKEKKKILGARFGIAQRESWQNIIACFLEVHGESRQCVPEKRLLFISTLPTPPLPSQDCDSLCMSFFWSHRENAIYIYVFALHTSNAIQWNMRPVSPHNA